MTNDLIQDVENSMRQERIDQFWREYGPYILGGALLAVLFTGLMATYRSYHERQAQHDTALLLQALDNKDPAAQAAQLDQAMPKVSGGARAIAQFSAAGVLLHDGKDAEALKHYKAAAADTTLPPVFRDLALWLSVRLDWSLHPDKAQAAAMIARLQPLIADIHNPWTWNARIEAAEIAAHGLNDYAKARATLAPVFADTSTAPPDLKQQAEALDHVYGLEQAAAAAPQTKTSG